MRYKEILKTAHRIGAETGRGRIETHTAETS